MAKRKINYDKVKVSEKHPSTQNALTDATPFFDDFKKLIIRELTVRTPLTDQDATLAVQSSAINELLKEDPQMVLHAPIDGWTDDIYQEYQNSK